MESKLPNRKIQFITLLSFLGFFSFQIFITISQQKDWYPFSPYKMFSKNWQNNIVMERIRFRNSIDGRIVSPWEVARIPFFQANHISFSVFLDMKNEAAKNDLCDAFKIKGHDVLREDVRYSLQGEKMMETIQTQEVVHECHQ